MNLPRCLTVLALLTTGAAAPAAGVTITPAQVSLRGKADRQQLLVTVKGSDRTRQVRFRSLTPHIVAVSPAGVVTPVGDGEGAVAASVDGHEVKAMVRVTRASDYLPATFERDVLPLLARVGCNSGACHGKARGQNG